MSKEATVKSEVYKVPYNKDQIIKLEGSTAQILVSQSELLGKILEKSFTHMFYLNGAAAVSMLALLANVLGKESDIWRRLLPCASWALIWFAAGTISAVICCMLSYVSQCYFNDAGAGRPGMIRNALGGQEKNENCVIFVENDSGEIKEINLFVKYGQWVRRAAMAFATFSLGCFIIGVYYCFQAFGAAI